MIKVGDYVQAKCKDSILNNECLIVREIDGDKVIVQYGKSGLKSETTIDKCRVVEVKEVRDVKLLFDCGVEKYMCMIESVEKIEDGIRVYTSANETSYVSNANKVVYSENNPSYKVWKDEYGVWDKVEE